MHQSTDIEIRMALHRKKFRAHHANPETLVINELGVAHGRFRVDIAVLNGSLHGYEIKSSKDTLSRLPAQIDAFSRCLERLSIIAAPRHLNTVMKIVPNWCGLIEADKGQRGAIHFRTIRLSTMNPSVDPIAMAHFLWHNEVTEILLELGVRKSNLKGPRLHLYQILTELLTERELAEYVKQCLRTRENWRFPLLPESCDGSPIPISKS